MTLLADLKLQDLPYDVLLVLRDAVHNEIHRRNQYATYQRAIAFAKNAPSAPTTYEEAIAANVRLNSRILCWIPRGRFGADFRYRLHYLSSVLGQDWTFLFPHSDDAEPTCYVYAHIDPREGPVRLKSLGIVLNGKPFYIGKGSGRRAWDLRRNQGHGKQINHIRKMGYADASIVQLIAENLTERQALELEAKLIYFFGSIHGEWFKGCLVNLADHVQPRFIKCMMRIPSPQEWYVDHPKAISESRDLPQAEGMST